MIKRNSIKAWYLAARPKTLVAAAVPVVLGGVYALTTTKEINLQTIMPGLLCLLFAFIMQIDANFINDYYDFISGRDTELRLGPLRACQQGWISRKAMQTAIFLTTLLACLIGLPLIKYGGIEMIYIGIACVIFCFLYTICMANVGLGDLLVLFFFGLIPCCTTYYIMMPEDMRNIPQLPWLLSVACGLMIDTLLIINNYRDIEIDKNTDKKTLAVYIGKKWTEWLYLCIGPVALILVLLQFGWTNRNILLCFGVYFFHISTWNDMRRISQGRELNKVLGKTARNIMIFGVLITLLIILS